MRRFFVAIILITSLFGGRTEARQDNDSPTIYLYIQVHENRVADGDELQLVPDWLDIYLLEVQSHLIAAGLNPQIVAQEPEILRTSLSMTVGDASDYDIFIDPPFSALAVSVSRWTEIDTLNMSPYVPFPYEPLPVGIFGWITSFTITDATYSQEALETMLGMALYVMEDCEAAIPHFVHVRETVDVQDTDLFVFSSPRFYEANCRYTLGQVDAAVKLLEEILATEEEEDSESVDERWFTDRTAINLAAIYLEKGLGERAIELLDRYQRLDPESFGVFERDLERYFARADLYLALDEPDQALAEINELVDHVLAEDTFPDASVAWLYTERGFRNQQIGDETAALADYERAIEIDSEYPVAYYRRGLLLSGDEARQDLETFLDLAPDFYSLHHPSLEPLIEDAESRLE